MQAETALIPDLLAGTPFAEARVLGKLGEGGRSTVYRALWNGQETALKIYKPTAVERHARKHFQDLAEFEYCQNQRIYQAPGLAQYVAQPMGYVVTNAIQAFMQEKLEGELYYFYYQARKGVVPARLFQQIETIVQLYHEAELYGLDLHSMNVMVVQDPGREPAPKLFDFNIIPVNVRAPNQFVALLMRTGLLSLRSRDLRKLRHFHNFDRVESKLLKFYR